MILALLLSASSAWAIMAGSEVPAGDPVARVSVKLASRRHSIGYSDCSGTRIAENFVLTAAHCWDVARFATLPDGTVAQVERSWRHERWNNDTDDYDFLLLKLKGHLPSGPAAELPDAGAVPGESLIMAGFGYTETGVDGILHETSVRVVRLSETQIQVAGAGTGMCGGDSGGGNFRVSAGRIVLAGVNSSTPEDDRYGCDDEGSLGDVSLIRDWIRAKISAAAESFVQ
jgi:hypothetical protein